MQKPRGFKRWLIQGEYVICIRDGCGFLPLQIPMGIAYVVMAMMIAAFFCTAVSKNEHYDICLFLSGILGVIMHFLRMLASPPRYAVTNLRVLSLTRGRICGEYLANITGVEVIPHRGSTVTLSLNSSSGGLIQLKKISNYGSEGAASDIIADLSEYIRGNHS